MIEPILLDGGKRIVPEDGAPPPDAARQVRYAGSYVQVCTEEPAS